MCSCCSAESEIGIWGIPLHYRNIWGGHSCPPGGSGRRATTPLNEFSLARTAKELVALYQHPSAGENNVRHSRDLDAFEHRIVNPHVVGLGADGVFSLGVENHQIGVAAHRNRAFARI